MALNLNSLKKIPVASENTSNKEEITSLPKEISKSSSFGIQKEAASISGITIPATGPKISLLKMKQASWIESAIVPKVETPVSEEVISGGAFSFLDQKQPEVVFAPIVPVQIIQEEKSISIFSSETTKETITSLPTENLIIKEETSPSEQSQSIFSTGEEEKQIVTQEVIETVATKEFFPNFHISGNENFGGDLLDIEDTVPSKESQKSIISEETTVEEEKIVLVPDEASPIEAPAVITQEYVAEVKTELSEKRRAGFRFFLQHKTKILTGIGIVSSLSLIALFSGSFLTIDMEKSGKTNIQETTTDILPTDNSSEMNPSFSDIPSESGEIIESDIIPSYELGRDYDIIKNTKKNIQKKLSISSSGEISQEEEIVIP